MLPAGGHFAQEMARRDAGIGVPMCDTSPRSRETDARARSLREAQRRCKTGSLAGHARLGRTLRMAALLADSRQAQLGSTSACSENWLGQGRLPGWGNRGKAEPAA